MSNFNRPDATLTLESGEKLTMSYLMLNDILRFVGGAPDAAMTGLMTSQDTRDLVLRRLLTENGKPIDAPEDLIPINDVSSKVSIFELDEIIAWVMDHVTYFFMRTAMGIEKATNRYPELLKEMKKES